MNQDEAQLRNAQESLKTVMELLSNNSPESVEEIHIICNERGPTEEFEGNDGIIYRRLVWSQIDYDINISMKPRNIIR